MKYIDTHSHIHFEDFDDDREEMFERMREEEVGAIAIGTNLETSKAVVEMARSEDARDVVLGVSIGVHPNEQEDFNEDDYKDLVQSEEVVAIGECGLDYFYSEQTQIDREHQKKKFIKQIDFAVLHKKVLMLHIRSSNDESGMSTDDAHLDALEILKAKKQEYGEQLKLHSHFTTFGIELGKEFVALGASFGIPGVVTYKNGKDVQELTKWLPLESIVVETDAPYAAPVPHRGKRNEPLFVIDTLRKVAELRGEDFEEVREQILLNTKRVFDILE